ncbi:MAG: acetolactate decarboxylase [Kiritimatiellae bacterium]|nr:acetolactate decarboxylase [Kiritimatiellia bacterium]MDW8458785.1 acetolactate decarboxylase [Verrucomicrobiota bacterium]
MSVRRTLPLSLGALILLAAGCGRTGDPHAAWRETVSQLSTFPAYTSGRYAASMAVSNLLDRGDHGFGFFEDGAGLVMHRGTACRIDADGRAQPAVREAAIAFAIATWFEPDDIFSVVNLNDRVFRNSMNWKKPDTGHVQAIRVEGRFKFVTLLPPGTLARSGSLQQGGTRTLEQVNGALVGFRMPESAGNSVPAGFNFYFIAADFSAGGEASQFELAGGRIEIDITPNLHLVLPTTR